MDKSALLAMLGPEIKQMIRDYIADVQGDLRVAGDSLITGRMSATDLSLDGREVELGWIKDKWVWYYGSATTILIYGEDVTEIFPIGTKLRWTQGGGWKYAYVIGRAYASGVNTLTVTGGRDYSVAITAIEDNYFAYSALVPGFPDFFNLTPPTWTTTGAPFTNAPIGGIYRITIKGKLVSIFMGALSGNPSGGTGTFIATFTASELPAFSMNASGVAGLSGSVSSGLTSIWSGAKNVMRMAKYDGSALFGSNQYFYANVIYLI